MAGYLNHQNGTLSSRGNYGIYFSSTQYSSTLAWSLNFMSLVCLLSNGDKADGHTLRCLRD
jgi:hypothetical protein